MTPGMVSTVGPVSIRYPPQSIRPARPPGTVSRSTTVTLRPRPARCSAAARPARPAPTTTTSSAAPVTVRTPSPDPVGGTDGEVAQDGKDEGVQRRALDGRVLQACPGCGGPVLDHALDLGDGAGFLDQVTPRRDLRLGEPVPRAQPVEPFPLGRRGQLAGQHHHARRLALAQVAAVRLAGDRRAAEHPEQVVAKLERLADQLPVPGERTEHDLVTARQRGPELQRPADGVIA